MKDRVQKFKPKHLEMIDFLAMHPGATNEEVGAALGISHEYVKQIVAGENFKAAVSVRKEELRKDLQVRYVQTMAKAYDATDAALEADKARIVDPKIEDILKDKAIDRVYALGHAKATERKQEFIGHANIPPAMLERLLTGAANYKKTIITHRLEKPSEENIIEAEVG
jgi:DNA-binding transcriptional regulator YdaS (Cro superfamily)